MLDELRLAPLLRGVRGEAPVDRATLVETVSRFSRLAAELPSLVEIEVNPLVAGSAGAIAVDARATLTTSRPVASAEGDPMAKRAAFPFLVATDGSSQARAAVTAAAGFPWPRGARPHVVVARGGGLAARWPRPIGVAVERGLERVADDAARVLRRRWPGTEVSVVELPPEEGILAEARRLRARAIVVGARGQGRLGRFVLGSVSRGLARHAPCPVLVVKGRQARPARRMVLGLDGSANGRRAIEFLAGLELAAGSRITVVHAVEPMRPPSGGLLPGAIRAIIAAEVKHREAERLQKARREVDQARARLARAGGAVSAVVRSGVPLPELLRAVADTRAELLVIGARGVGGFERLLLGSVAEGVLARSPVSVLLVR